MSEIAVTFFGPLDTLVGPYIEEILLVLVVSNILTRKLAHDYHQRQAADDDTESLSRHPLHVFSMWGLTLASLYYLTIHHHAGFVMTTLVLGVFVTDFFEFEARQVELREGHGLERPKAAVVASVVALLYVGYHSVFFLLKPFWSAVI